MHHLLVVENWRGLAGKLGIERIKIEEFHRDLLWQRRSYFDVIEGIIEFWCLAKGDDATLENLITAVRLLNSNDVASKYIYIGSNMNQHIMTELLTNRFN